MNTPAHSLDRRQAVAALLRDRDEALVVSGLGSPTYDVHAAGDDPANFYLWGAMGGAALVGLGLAIAQPTKRVLVITGDGEQLMGFGSLATIAVAAPSNLDIIVLDNERYGETGGQHSHTAHQIDLAAAASACGFGDTAVLNTIDDVVALAASDDWHTTNGPRLYVLKISAEPTARSLPTRDAVLIKNRFRSHLGLSPN